MATYSHFKNSHELAKKLIFLKADSQNVLWKEVRFIMVFHVSYDLRKPGRDYSGLYDQIKKFGEWCHPLESSWYVDCPFSAEQIRDVLISKIDVSDGLVVTVANAPAAWYGLTPTLDQWLFNHLH